MPYFWSITDVPSQLLVEDSISARHWSRYIAASLSRSFAFRHSSKESMALSQFPAR